jgi:putative transposase
MALFRGKYRIESTRLRRWDYDLPGWYFVTICVRDRKCVFGEITAGELQATPLGRVAAKHWIGIPSHYENVHLDAWVLMPNHLHGIVVLAGDHPYTPDPVPIGTYSGPTLREHIPVPGSLATVIRSYKAGVVRWARQNGYADFAWQQRFHDRIIRSEKMLNAIRDYIDRNPSNWLLDADHPQNAQHRVK